MNLNNLIVVATVLFSSAALARGREAPPCGKFGGPAVESTLFECDALVVASLEEGVRGINDGRTLNVRLTIAEALSGPLKPGLLSATAHTWNIESLVDLGQAAVCLETRESRWHVDAVWSFRDDRYPDFCTRESFRQWGELHRQFVAARTPKEVAIVVVHASSRVPQRVKPPDRSWSSKGLFLRNLVDQTRLMIAPDPEVIMQHVAELVENRELKGLHAFATLGSLASGVGDVPPLLSRTRHRRWILQFLDSTDNEAVCLALSQLNAEFGWRDGVMREIAVDGRECVTPTELRVEKERWRRIVECSEAGRSCE